MRELVNWSGHLKQTKCHNTVRTLTQHHYFWFLLEVVPKFQPSDTCAETSKGHRHLVCNLLRNIDDIWHPLRERNCSWVTSFLKFIRSLVDKPTELITKPKDIDKVTARVESEQSIIDHQRKLESLYTLREPIHGLTIEQFHWNLTTIVDLNHFRDHKEAWYESQRQMPRVNSGTEYRYTVRSIMICKHDPIVSGLPFWVAENLDVSKFENKATSMLVCWNEAYRSADLFTAI